MAEYIVTSPDGKKYRVTAPEGTSKEEINAYVQKQFASDKARSSFEHRGLSTKPQGTTLDRAMANQAAQSMPIPTVSQNPTTGMSTGGLALAGAGKATADIVRGAGQTVGLVSPADVAETNRLDAPLLETTPGMVGNVIGNAVDTLPAFMAPGAATVKGAALAGGIVGALAPTEEDNVLFGKAKNAALGAGLSAGMTVAGNAISGAVTSKEAELAKRRVEEEIKRETTRDGLKAGFSVPPANANPTIKNKTLQGMAGKAATEQQTSIQNAPVRNRLILEDIGMNPAAPVNKEDLFKHMKVIGQSYDRVKNLGDLTVTSQFNREMLDLKRSAATIENSFPGVVDTSSIQLADKLMRPNGSRVPAEALVELAKDLKFTGNLNKYNTAAGGKPDPAKVSLGRAQLKAVEAIENLLDKNLRGRGDTTTLNEFRKARVLYAKTGLAVKALNDATGDFSAGPYLKAYKKGDPLTGNSELVGRFAAGYPKANQDITFASPGISPLDVAVGSGVSAVSGDMRGLAMVVGRPTVRKWITSPGYQARNTTPDYQLGAGLSALRGVSGPRGQAGLKSLLLPNLMDKFNAPESD